MSSLPRAASSVAGASRTWGPGARLALLGVLALLCLLAFMTVGVRTDWAFVLEHRGAKVLTMALVLLVGMVGGIFFRSLAGLAMRVLDPNEFTVLQDRMFANFNAVNLQLLLPSLLLIAVGSAWIWRQRRVLDVISLGRDAAVSLGVDYERRVLRLLAVVACLVAVSTALVGPVVFFGLLVSNMAYHAMGTRRHAWVLPAAVLWGCVLLMGGQVLLEQLFKFNTVLSIVVEFLGGIVFIVLLMRKGTP
jgi:iron complex transport system permease protein